MIAKKQKINLLFTYKISDQFGVLTKKKIIILYEKPKKKIGNKIVTWNFIILPNKVIQISKKQDI